MRWNAEWNDVSHGLHPPVRGGGMCQTQLNKSTRCHLLSYAGGVGFPRALTAPPRGLDPTTSPGPSPWCGLITASLFFDYFFNFLFEKTHRSFPRKPKSTMTRTLALKIIRIEHHVFICLYVKTEMKETKRHKKTFITRA